MKSIRVLFVLIGLSSLPLVAVAAQGQSGGPNNPNAVANRCKNAPQAGKNGNSQAGIKGTDTLVFVLDILASTR